MTPQRDLSTFFKDLNRKLLHPHGLAHLTISPLRSTYSVMCDSKLRADKQVGHAHCTFHAPSMYPCRDGDDEWHFDSMTQNDAAHRLLSSDTLHDILLAAWVEKGPSVKCPAACGMLARKRPIKWR